MHFRRLKEANDEIFLKAFALYETSFPIFERRSKNEQVSILFKREYHFDVIYDENEFVGLMLYWETESFLYIEHFCIKTNIRGNGYGQKALNLLNEKKKTIILEIDPPVDEIAIRRKNFYLKAAYVENLFAHIHPPYKPNFKGHELVILSYPSALTAEQYKFFNSYLIETVMRKV